MKKSVCIIFIILFMGLCAMPLFGLVFGYENVNAEKRELAQSPEIIADGVFNFDFTKQFDDYFTDQFAFRTDFVTLFAQLKGSAFGESVSEQVIIGKDGWLFFERTLRDYKKENVLSENEIGRLVRTLEIQRDALSQRGIGFVFTIAPNKASVYGHYMPERYVITGTKSNAEKLFEALSQRGFDYVDLFAALRGNSRQVYHKLDTHWNNTGALIAYDTLLGRVQALLPQFDYTQYELDAFVESATWEGDLSAMLYPATRMRDMQQDYGIQKLYDSARPIRSLEEMKIETTSESGSLQLLMFRDSFANALIPIMSNEFAAATYSRALPYDYALLTEQTDVVILQIVERNLPELLLFAPKLSAPLAEIVVPEQAAAMDCDIAIAYDAAHIRISGIAKPQDYQQSGSYDIYVRLTTGDNSQVFVPFPILDRSVYEGQEAQANSAFTLRIDKSYLSAKEYAVQIIVFDGAQYSVYAVPDTLAID